MAKKEDNSSLGKHIKGVPIDALIGGPLQAACKANMMLASSTADFIKTVGFELDKDGNPTAPRMADFLFEKPNQNDAGEYIIDEVHVQVPMLAIVPIPNLQLDKIAILFDLEVNFSTVSASESDFESLDGSVKMYGKTAAHKENLRKSDYGAKYHFEVHASNAGTPEGLSRVLDMMAQSIAPKKISSRPNNNVPQIKL